MVVAMPIVLFVLFAIIYTARMGVVSERAELALRYGGITQFNSTSNSYSAANIYATINSDMSQGPSPCPTAPVSIFAGGSPMPGPTSAPFWQPDTDVAPPSSTCTSTVIGFGGAQFMATHYMGASILNVTANLDVPTYLKPLMGSSAVISTTAQFVHSAYPGLILYCSKEVHDRVWAAITAESTTMTPPPGPPNNGVCK